METSVPREMTAAIELDRRDRRRRLSRHTVVAGDRVHPVLEFGPTSFVIEADGRPPLRGYVDFYEGDRLIAQRLVLCASAEDGLVAYEVKLDNGGREIAPDYAPSDRPAGLLTGPGSA